MPLGLWLPWSPHSGAPAGSGSQGINYILPLDFFLYLLLVRESWCLSLYLQTPQGLEHSPGLLGERQKAQKP